MRLEAELAVCAKLLDSASPDKRVLISKSLNHWRNVDPDLVGIRNVEAVSKLTDEEQRAARGHAVSLRRAP